jgi:hypothetical protein
MKEGAMIPSRVAGTVFAALFLAASHAGAQQSPGSRTGQASQGSMPGMKMPAMNDHMHHDADTNPDAARSAIDAMSGAMNMNAHMFMTSLRPENPQDDERAAEIVEVLRKSIDRYKDYRVALADGFQIFLPNVPQEHYHFTNYRYAFEASFAFNLEHPTSLLYKKVNGTYELEGAMLTARRKATEDELNERVPLSVARWHKHVNLCLPPKGTSLQTIDWKEFGPGGSISTKDACDEAGGRWIPQVFGWMVHVYPYETDPAKIWAH